MLKQFNQSTPAAQKLTNVPAPPRDGRVTIAASNTFQRTAYFILSSRGYNLTPRLHNHYLRDTNRCPCRAAAADSRQHEAPADMLIFSKTLDSSNLHPASGVFHMCPPPPDLSPSAACLATDELLRLYDLPLVAPRTFARVVWQREASRIGAVPAAHVRQTVTSATAAPGPSTLPGEGRTPYGMPHTMTSGFLVDSSRRQRLLRHRSVVQHSAAPAAVTHTRHDMQVVGRVSDDDRETTTLRTTVSSLEADGGMAFDRGGVSCLRNEAAVQKSRRTATSAAAAGAAAAAAAPAMGSKGPGRSQWVWRGDPAELPRLSSEQLGCLLVECAAAGVALRRSSLQAYLDAVRTRAIELPAPSLVAVLEGVANYRTSLPQLRTSVAAAATVSAADLQQASTPLTHHHSDPGGGGGGGGALGSRSRSAGSGRQHAFSCPSTGSLASSPTSNTSSLSSPSSWIDVILDTLLLPQDASPSPSRPQHLTAPKNRIAPAASLPPTTQNVTGGWEEGDRRTIAKGTRRSKTGGSSSSSSGSSHDSTRNTSVGAPSAPRAAFLSPYLLVRLLTLLVQLNLRPNPVWTNSLLQSTTGMLSYMNGEQLLALLPAVEELAADPDLTWWDAVMAVWADPDQNQNQVTDDAVRGGSVAAPSVLTGARVGGASGSRTAEGQQNDVLRGDAAAEGEMEITEATEATAGVGPSVWDVRCSILYFAARLGNWTSSTLARQPIQHRQKGRSSPSSPTPATEGGADRLRRWAQDTLYDCAMALLPYLSVCEEVPQETAEQAGMGALSGGGGDAATGVVVLRRYVRQVPPPLAAAVTSSSLGAVTSEPTSSQWMRPSPMALARALASLPYVVPYANVVSRGVLEVLLSSLEPHLVRLPPELLLGLLAGFSDSGIHPGPRFLRRHALVLKSTADSIPPRQLLRAGQQYRKLGLLTAGGLKAAITRAREKVQKEAERERSRAERRGPDWRVPERRSQMDRTGKGEGWRVSSGPSASREFDRVVTEGW